MPGGGGGGGGRPPIPGGGGGGGGRPPIPGGGGGGGIPPGAPITIIPLKSYILYYFEGVVEVEALELVDFRLEPKELLNSVNSTLLVAFR